jgi:hypothetical protein
MSTNDIIMAAAGAAGGAPANYIEDVFSTTLYTGNGSSQNIINGVDLATYGGMVWMKSRSSATTHRIFDTSGRTGILSSDTTNAQNEVGAYPTYVYGLTNGFNASSTVANSNNLGVNYASWTFRKQPKFFDVVTWTGNGAVNRTIAHSLGCVPGCVMVKATSASGFWFVSSMLSTTSPYGVPNRTWTSYPNYFALNRTDGTYGTAAGNRGAPSATDFTDTTFNLSGFGESGTIDGQGGTNLNGVTYVAYLFAHNAGGFGLTGTDNVISCGSFTTNGSGNATVNLGYEPQWVMIKRSDASENWYVIDNMRGWPAYPNDQQVLFPNLSAAEISNGGFYPTATGFQSIAFNASATYIYIAIRRGPMKVPTDATKVFSSSANQPDPSGNWNLTTLVDLMLQKSQGTQGWYWKDRLRNANSSGTVYLNSATTSGESTYGNPVGFQRNVNYLDDYYGPYGYAGFGLARAPSFLDVVCYTGTGSATTFNHNLGVAPEMMIVKSRIGAVNWKVYQKDLGTLYGSGQPAYLYNLTLNSTASTDFSASRWSQDPTSTVFGVATNADTNGSGSTYVAYLFATCAGVSKVGSYTGTGATQTISCGFTGGARFVMIKRTNSSGDWYVWDTARGMVSGTDPSLLLNSDAAEVNANSIYTTTGGFQIVSTAAGINASGGTYIFLAIA